MAPTPHFSAALCDLIRSSKAMLIDWLTAATTTPATRLIHPTTRWSGENWHRFTAHTTPITPPASQPGVAADTDKAGALAFLKLPGGKPKGMHWRTFERLQAAHDAHVNQWLAGMSVKLGLVMDRLGRIKI